MQNYDTLELVKSNGKYSALKCGDYKHAKEHIFHRYQEHSIDTLFLSTTGCNHRNVIEEKYYDPRLYNIRLAILVQERLYFK